MKVNFFVAFMMLFFVCEVFSQTNTSYKGCKIDGDNSQAYTKYLGQKRFTYDQYTYFDRENYDSSITAPFSNDYYTQYGNCRYFSVNPAGTGKRCSVEGITYLDMNARQLKREGDEITYTLYDNCNPINNAPLDDLTILVLIFSGIIGFLTLKNNVLLV